MDEDAGVLRSAQDDGPMDETQGFFALLRMPG